MAKSNSDNQFEEQLWKEEMTTSTIKKWPIFSELPPSMSSRIRMVAVFGKGDDAIYFTGDDEAFGLGHNKYGCLGVGHENKCLEPAKIEGLTNVKIKTMAFGFRHVVAVTENGSVLAWGDNKYYQLGNGTTNKVLVPEQVSALDNHRVVEVACGADHTLALTQNGEVFSWGANYDDQLGMGSTGNPEKPKKVTEVIGSLRAVAVGCCEKSSFVVTDEGKVYAWGDQKNLGLECDSNQLIPTRIDGLNGVKIRRLACGGSHVLALAEDESIYVWGSNNLGQLGTGDEKEKEMPMKIEMPGVRFIEVAASIFNKTSVGLTCDGRCWVWGECWSGLPSLLIPKPVGSASVYDAFAEFSDKPVTWKPFLVRQPPTNRAIDRLKSAFDDQTKSDFKFVVDDKPIYLNRSVLKIQSQYFQDKFSGEWSKSIKNEVKVEQWSYPVFRAFLNYLYTGDVDLPIDQIIQLIDLANFYHEPELEIKCHRQVLKKLSVENAAFACSKSDSVNQFKNQISWKEEMTTSTIEKWPILRRLPQKLASQIWMTAVFGLSGKSANFFTSDGEAFGLGDNNYGCLGVGHENECLEPTKIEGLTNVKIKTMAFGFRHVVAVTEKGSVFAWGDNENYKLGNGNANNVLVPEQVSALNNHRVVDVACGGFHTLALTENGEIFAWGSNNSGQLGSITNSKLPVKVTEVIGSRRTVAIGCCECSSFAVMDNGEVYAWGYRGNLGLECDSDTEIISRKTIPTRIDGLNGVKIQRLACGGSHVLALSEDKSVFVWGVNDCGQLGTGDTEKRDVPVNIETPTGVKFVEVAASIFNGLSVAFSEDGRCWVWGECRSGSESKSVLIPELVESASLHDAFVEFGDPRVTWKPFLVRQPPTNLAIDKLKSAFDDPTTSDFMFLVDGKQIHAHRSLLKIQSQHFQTMFSGDWSESVKDEVEEPWSYTVFRAFIEYLYTDKVVDLLVEEIIQLIVLSNCYDEPELETKCHRLFRQKLSVQNVALAYSFARESSANSIEDYCFLFIADHFDDVKKTEAFQSLDEEIKKKIICACERANKKLKTL